MNNKQHNMQLLKKYPKLFSGKLIDGRIACDNGWYNLIDDLCLNIDKLFKDSGLPDDKYPVASQVKEKFGGLRFYMNAVDESIFKQMSALIEEAERKSQIVCEKCGDQGKIHKIKHLTKCLCDTCKYLYDNFLADGRP